MTTCTLYGKTKKTLTDAVGAAVFALLLLQPVLDVISYWATVFECSAITTLARFAMFALVMLYAFLISDRKRTYVIFAAALCLFWIAHMIACFKAPGGYKSPVADAGDFLRTVQMPFFTLAFITCFKKSDRVPVYVQAGFLVNMILMMHFLILSYMTGTQIYTYVDARVGLMGWANVHNSQSAILAFVVPLILFYIYKMKKPVLFYFTALICFVDLFFVGTRVDYFSIPIIGVAMIFFLIVSKEKNPAYYVTLGAIVVLCLVCFNSSVVNSNIYNHTISMSTKQSYIDDTLEDVHTPSGNPLPSHIDKETFDSLTPRAKYEILKIYELYAGPMVQRFGFDRVFEEYDYSLEVSELTAVRNQKKLFAKMVWDDSNLLTKCFGYEYSNMVVDYKTVDKDGVESVTQVIYDLENDFPAIYYMGGYVGFAFYIAFLAYFALLIIVGLITRFKKLFTLESGMVGVTFVLMLGIAQYAGYVLRRPNASIYLSAILAYIYWLTAVRENVKLRDIFKVFSKNRNF